MFVALWKGCLCEGDGMLSCSYGSRASYRQLLMKKKSQHPIEIQPMPLLVFTRGLSIHPLLKFHVLLFGNPAVHAKSTQQSSINNDAL